MKSYFITVINFTGIIIIGIYKNIASANHLKSVSLNK